MPGASTVNGAPIVCPDSGPVFAKNRCQCGGLMLVLAGDFVSWNYCIACGKSELVAWMSCRPATLGCPPEKVAGNTAADGSQP